MRKLLTIEGMSCGHCVMRAESELREVAGVEDVSIELVKKSAMITGVNLNDVALRAAVERAGYTVSRIIGSN
ncbi:MAG: heavy-metal-associated domain-containing protein [Spirochaetes bacterium]|nr:heavy-metal-associated domain-containing protein [Spirochaetota bacterium]MBU0954653.1 heavy-metal-associated domain-containing protein [Spirochaetota bacterium]